MAYIPQPGRKRERIDGVEHVSANRIIEAVEKHFEITRDDLIRRCRRIEIVYPRQVATYLLAHYTALTLKSIAFIFNQDHTTIIHSMQVMEDYIDCDANVKVQLDAIASTF